jgi:iron-sulfur cluster assembly protein
MIQVTEKAAKRIRELLLQDGLPQTAGLRLGVQGGGCSGLSYAMRMEQAPRGSDQIVELNGARVFIDPKSRQYLDEITLDYEETLMRKGFLFQNPKATKTCGCGSSFAVS